MTKNKEIKIDWDQGEDELGRKFGYVAGDGGGWFFTHFDSVAEMIESLEIDEIDGDGGVTCQTAETMLVSYIAEKKR